MKSNKVMVHLSKANKELEKALKLGLLDFEVYDRLYNMILDTMKLHINNFDYDKETELQFKDRKEVNNE